MHPGLDSERLLLDPALGLAEALALGLGEREELLGALRVLGGGHRWDLPSASRLHES
jgi:hypothetical protein